MAVNIWGMRWNTQSWPTDYRFVEYFAREIHENVVFFPVQLSGIADYFVCCNSLVSVQFNSHLSKEKRKECTLRKGFSILNCLHLIFVGGIYHFTFGGEKPKRTFLACCSSVAMTSVVLCATDWKSKVFVLGSWEAPNE